MQVKRPVIILTYCAVRSFTMSFKMQQNISNSSKVYDLVVIGGGSGGLACAKEGL